MWWFGQVPTKDHGDQPALLIQKESVIAGAPIWAMPLSNIHNYFNSDGTVTPHAMAQAPKIAEYLGFSATDKAARNGILDLLWNATPDLIKQPPVADKPSTAPTQGELVLTIDGQTVAEREIRADGVLV